MKRMVLSLIIVPQTVPVKNTYTVSEESGTIEVATKNLRQSFRKIIDIAYDDTTHTVFLGARKGQFSGMLKQRRFNIVLITKEAPHPLNHQNPEGKMVQYNGKAVTVQL